MGFLQAAVRPVAGQSGDMPRERLQKLMAAAGFCSRRRGEELLRQGRVRVNGRPAGVGDQADAARDRIEVDGRPLQAAPASLTLLLNKPLGVLCTCHDPQGRPTVLDLLPPPLRRGQGLHPVGRLDADSRGALLLSNDGDLTLRLTHPRYGHRRSYRVWVRGIPDAATLQHWRAGVPLDGQSSQPVALRLLECDGDAALLELEMGEGRNRQIRRTAALLGHPVLDLQRTAIGPWSLGELPEGRWRRLQPEELNALTSGSVEPTPARHRSRDGDDRRPRAVQPLARQDQSDTLLP
jgi:pseudouridine synthase